MSSATLSEPNVSRARTERMNFRTKPHIKQAIQRAAALLGLDDSVFTLNSAYAAALDTIATHERTVLLSEDHGAFFKALDNPPALTDTLKAAHDRYKSRVIS